MPSWYFCLTIFFLLLIHYYCPFKSSRFSLALVDHGTTEGPEIWQTWNLIKWPIQFLNRPVNLCINFEICWRVSRLIWETSSNVYKDNNIFGKGRHFIKVNITTPAFLFYLLVTLWSRNFVNGRIKTVSNEILKLIQSKVS